MDNKRNIITFDNYYQFNNFIKDKGLLEKIGEGSEGICYLSSTEQKVYKILYETFKKQIIEMYTPSQIITTKDIELKHFYLPEELYTMKQQLLGYKTKYLPTDLFDFDKRNGNPTNLYRINFDKLIKAYYRMLKEIEKLSKEKIQIYDLSHNLMFTGANLIGIDTCGYERNNSKSIHGMSLLEFNTCKLDDAIREVFASWIINSNNLSIEDIFELNEEENTEKYLKKLKKQIKQSR